MTAMGMITFKGFDKGLVCREFRFIPFEDNVCEKAKTANCGFHSARNPLDCLKYYPVPEKSEYWICAVSGDVDEDSVDSKVASTVIKPVQKLNLTQLLYLGLTWIWTHRSCEADLKRYSETGQSKNGYAIAVGKKPIVHGESVGDCLAMMETETGAISVGVVGEDGIKPGVWYGMGWKEVKANGKP